MQACVTAHDALRDAAAASGPGGRSSSTPSARAWRPATLQLAKAADATVLGDGAGTADKLEKARALGLDARGIL